MLTIGTAAVIAFWVIFTIRKGFDPKVARAIKANDYDRKGSNPDAKKRADRLRHPLTAAKWALRVAGWVETVLLVLLIAWLVFFIGAILTGTTIVLGYPV